MLGRLLGVVLAHLGVIRSTLSSTYQAISGWFLSLPTIIPMDESTMSVLGLD